MRSISTSQLQIWQNKKFKIKAKISIFDGSNWVDLATWQNREWLYSISLEDDIENDVAEATIKLISKTANYSISPFIYSDSILQINKKIRIEVCLFPDNNWINIFEGYIDSIDCTKEEIIVRCRDLGALLIDTFIQQEQEYGTDTGTLVEGEMQKILDNNLGTGIISLYVPVSSNWYVKKWKQEKTSIMEALRNLAEQIGWCVRYKWDNSTSSWRLTFFEPARNKTIPDITLNSEQYFEIKSMNIDVKSIRNKICVQYIDSSSAQIQNVIVQDDTSIQKYGLRYMEINCGKASNIDTQSEAETLANNILADLKDPVVNLEIEIPFNPFIELNDCVLLPANNILFNSDQLVYVNSISHNISYEDEECITTLRLSGRAIYGITKWLRKETRNTGILYTIRESKIIGENYTTSTSYVDIPGSCFKVILDTGEKIKSIFEINCRNTNYETISGVRLVRINSDGSITEIASVSTPFIYPPPSDYPPPGFVLKMLVFLENYKEYKFQFYSESSTNTFYVFSIQRKDYI